MKKAILVFLFTVFEINLFPQTNVYYPFPDSNATWIETHGLMPSGCYVPIEKYEVYISKDTLINTVMYKKVDYHAYHYYQQIIGGTCFMPNPYYFNGTYGYYRNVTLARRVYVKPNNTAAEYLLYDFSKQPGDTVFTYGNGINWYIIDSLDSILIGNKYRLRQNIHGSGGSTNTWPNTKIIEGVGAERNGLKLYPQWLSGYDDLLCFSQNNQKLYPNTSGVCQPINLIPDYSLKKFKIFPNPANDNIYIEGIDLMKNTTINILNILGETLFEMQLKNTYLDVRNLKEGIYFLDIIPEQGVIERKKIIIFR